MKFSIFVAFAVILQIVVSQDDECTDLTSVIIKSIKSDMVVCGDQDGSTVEFFTGNETQLWELVDQGNGFFTITNKATGKPLQIPIKLNCTLLEDALEKMKKGTLVPPELSAKILGETEDAVVCLGDEVKTLCEEVQKSANQYLQQLCEAKKPLNCTAWQDAIDEVKEGKPTPTKLIRAVLSKNKDVIACLEDQAEDFDPKVVKMYCNLMKRVGITSFRCEETTWKLEDGYISSKDGNVVGVKDEDFTSGNGLELTEKHDGEEQKFEVIYVEEVTFS